VVPGTRLEADLQAGRFEPPCPRCGRVLRPELVNETAPLDPRSVYAATKVAQEHLASAWATGTGGSVTALRYHNVYGPDMPKDTPYAGVAAIFRSALAAGRPPEVFEDGGQRRDFVHVRDVATANILALEGAGAPGLTAYNIGSGEVHTIGEMARVLAAAAAGPEPVVSGRFRAGDVRHITASSARAQETLEYRAAIDFEAGMTEFAGARLRGD
jgi:dTDP-L-rhamnose 4-epimerase